MLMGEFDNNLNESNYLNNNKSESFDTLVKKTTIENKQVDKVENLINKPKKYFFNTLSTYKEKYIIFENVSKEYNNESASTIALDNASFSINEGELVIFLGHSGAGKSTALNLLGGMDSPSKGRIIVGDKEITNYSLEELVNYRRKNVGFIFQFYNLISNLSVIDNIKISTEIAEESIDASIILEKVGLIDKLDVFPGELSGGEQQRVAIARALAKKPKILLCDEPTGALDYLTGKNILKLIQKMCRTEHITTVIITHNPALTSMGDKIVYFNSGKVVDVRENKYPIDVEELEW